MSEIREISEHHRNPRRISGTQKMFHIFSCDQKPLVFDKVIIMFNFDISNELKILIRKLLKKDKVRVEILNKKIKEIIDNDNKSVDRYKNCSYELKEYKRVLIDKSFVLLFKVYKEKNMIYFWRLRHHDEVYKK